jgi:hypothetical protein
LRLRTRQMFRSPGLSTKEMGVEDAFELLDALTHRRLREPPPHAPIRSSVGTRNTSAE